MNRNRARIICLLLVPLVFAESAFPAAPSTLGNLSIPKPFSPSQIPFSVQTQALNVETVFGRPILHFESIRFQLSNAIRRIQSRFRIKRRFHLTEKELFR